MAKGKSTMIAVGDAIVTPGSDEPVGVVTAVEPVTGCVVCGLNTGSFTEVAGAARAHAECAAARPDVISKVKARA